MNETLDLAIKNGHVAAVRAKLRHWKTCHKDVMNDAALCDDERFGKMSVLNYALLNARNTKMMVKMLVDEGARLDFTNVATMTFAAPEVVPFLKQMGADANKSFDRFYETASTGTSATIKTTPLCYAAYNADYKKIEALIDAGAYTKDAFAKQAVIECIEADHTTDKEKIFALNTLQQKGVDILNVCRHPKVEMTEQVATFYSNELEMAVFKNMQNQR